MKHKTKQTLKTILLGALGIGAIVGVASGVNTLVEKNDTELKTIYPTFEVGGLRTEDGKYEKSDKTLYTKNAFECQGLQIKLAFDNYIDYQVFFYEDDGDFISASSVISGNETIDIPLTATHARLELTPNWSEMGEDYAKEKDQIVKWYETTKYSSQIEVKVNKEQSEIEYVSFMNKDFIIAEKLNQVKFTESSLSLGADGTISYRESAVGYAMTDCYLLKVKGGETISFVNKLNLTGMQYAVVELYGDDYQINLNAPTFAWLSDSYTIDDNTDYIILNIKGNIGTSFTSEQLATLNSCFNIVG